MPLLVAALIALLQQEPFVMPVPRSAVTCSKSRPGFAALTLRWPARRATGLVGSHLEVTIYHRGFERRLFAILPASADSSLPIAFSERTSERDRALTAYKLRVTGWRTQRDTNVAVVDGLQPGILYSWRVAPEGDSRFLAGPASPTLPHTCGLERKRRG